MTHKVERLLAISVHKQTDYATALADAAIDKILLPNSYDLKHEPVQITDEDKIGKGHDWATEIQLESWNTELSIDHDANSLILPWLLGLYFGPPNTTVVQASKAWQHVFKYSDRVAAASQDPVTSIIDKMGGFRTAKAPSMAMDVLTLSGELEKRIKATATLVGSGMLSTGATAPTGAPAVTSIFINQMLKLEIGPVGGSFAEVAARWHNWQLQGNKNIQRDSGFYPGSGFLTTGDASSGAIRGRAEYGKRRAALTLGLRVQTGSTEYSELKAATRLKAKITATGASIPTTSPDVKFSFILEFPNYAYKVLSIAEIGDGIELFNLESLLFYDATAIGDMTATVVTNEAEFMTNAA